MSSSSSWPVTPGIARRPRWRVLLAGQPLAGCESVSVHQTNHRAAGTLSAKFALNADPGSLTTWTDAAPPVSIEVQAAFLAEGAPEGSEDWQSIFVGDGSDAHIDLPNGSVEATARDLAGRLIDGKTTQTYANQTSSQVAQTVAAHFGLTADVDSTTVLTGSYYQLEHDKLVNNSFSRTTTFWDLLSYLARQEGYDLWVDGRTLHFKRAVDPSATTPVPLVWSPASGADAWPSIPVTDIQMSRSCTLAKGVQVIVKIWDSRQKTASVVRYPSGQGTGAQEYVYVRPGWSQQAALAYAQAQYADILRHERTVTVSMPGDLTMTQRSMVSLTGTGTSFDTVYFVDEIERSFSLDGGFTQRLTLKNHPVQSDADVE